MPITKLPVVGVMGSGDSPHEDLAQPLARMLAELPVHLLTGGGKGTMTSVSKAFVECDGRAGLCMGVVPAATLEDPTRARKGYPNRWIELPIYTHLIAKHPDAWGGLTRNHINILTSDVVVALPGARGTTHEIELAVRYAKPVITYFHEIGEMPGLPDDVRQSTDLDEVRAFVEEQLGVASPKPKAGKSKRSGRKAANAAAASAS